MKPQAVSDARGDATPSVRDAARDKNEEGDLGEEEKRSGRGAREGETGNVGLPEEAFRSKAVVGGSGGVADGSVASWEMMNRGTNMTRIT